MGVPFFDQWGIVGGHAEAYRWHINDPIIFNTGIRVTIEHWGWMSQDENPNYREMSWNEREDDYSSVAFWYRREPTFTERAPDARARRSPSLERLIVPAAQFTNASFHGEGEARRNNWTSTTIRKCYTNRGRDRGHGWKSICCHQ